MPDCEQSTPGDRFGHPALPGPVPVVELYPGESEGGCPGNTQRDHAPQKEAEDKADRGAHVLLRLQVAKANVDMDEPGKPLEAAQPDAVLQALPGQHEAPYEDRQARRQRQKTCGAAGGIHAGGVAEQDRPAAGPGLGESHVGEALRGENGTQVRRRPPSVGTESYNRQSIVRKRSKKEREEKKKETSPKP